MKKSIRDEWIREMKRGSVQLLILATIGKGKKYGFQIVKELGELSSGYFALKEGTLYPALHRLEKRGYLLSEWVTQSSGNPRKYYSLTPDGTDTLSKAKDEWKLLVERSNDVLEGSE